jgi:hypothetical protein
VESRVVELAGLADLQGARTEQDDFFYFVLHNS